MRVLRLVTVLAAAAVAPVGFMVASTPAATPARTERAPGAPAQQPPKGIRLANLTWPEATAVLRPETVVVIPLGAGSKEHGPHLKLNSDAILADYLTRRVLDASDVVVAPALPYHFYPAFVEYSGSTSLELETARALTTDVALSLARHGPRRFYVLNTGISTSRAIDPAARALAAQGILLGHTDLGPRLDRASAAVRQQQGGTHADEVETSMMLFVDPDAVNMRLAVKEYTPSPGPLRLTRTQGNPGTFSASGIWGDPTLATKEKGRVIVEALVAGILDDIEALRRAPLPSPSALPTPPVTVSRPPAAGGSADPRSCTPGDERTIRALGDAFTLHWTNADALHLAGLWSEEGDMVHPDGRIERTRETIRTNRFFLFAQREYRGSRHPLTLGTVRCINADVAVADGKWELRGVSDSAGKPLPTFEGLCTLVVQRKGGWQIEAYRYTQKPAAAPMPTLLKRPGFPGGPQS
jgi:creatinine amidohydrolase